MSRKNSAMAVKNSKARKERSLASRRKAYDISAMEYHFGDWTPIADSVKQGLLFSESFYDKQQERYNLSDAALDFFCVSCTQLG